MNEGMVAHQREQENFTHALLVKLTSYEFHVPDGLRLTGTYREDLKR